MTLANLVDALAALFIPTGTTRSARGEGPPFDSVLSTQMTADATGESDRIAGSAHGDAVDSSGGATSMFGRLSEVIIDVSDEESSSTHHTVDRGRGGSSVGAPMEGSPVPDRATTARATGAHSTSSGSRRTHEIGDERRVMAGAYHTTGGDRSGITVAGGSGDTMTLDETREFDGVVERPVVLAMTGAGEMNVDGIDRSPPVRSGPPDRSDEAHVVRASELGESARRGGSGLVTSEKGPVPEPPSQKEAAPTITRAPLTTVDHATGLVEDTPPVGPAPVSEGTETHSVNRSPTPVGDEKAEMVSARGSAPPEAAPVQAPAPATFAPDPEPAVREPTTTSTSSRRGAGTETFDGEEAALAGRRVSERVAVRSDLAAHSSPPAGRERGPEPPVPLPRRDEGLAKRPVELHRTPVDLETPRGPSATDEPPVADPLSSVGIRGDSGVDKAGARVDREPVLSHPARPKPTPGIRELSETPPRGLTDALTTPDRTTSGREAPEVLRRPAPLPVDRSSVPPTLDRTVRSMARAEPVESTPSRPERRGSPVTTGDGERSVVEEPVTASVLPALRSEAPPPGLPPRGVTAGSPAFGPATVMGAARIPEGSVSTESVSISIPTDGDKVMRVQVTVRGFQVVARIVPPDAVVADQLVRNRDELRAALADRGFEPSIAVRGSPVGLLADTAASSDRGSTESRDRFGESRDQSSHDGRSGRRDDERESSKSPPRLDIPFELFAEETP